jgi:predicted amidophosphoribosyltransferase
VPTSREPVDVDAEPVAGLEPTRIQEPEVYVERMPDLIANEEVLGDTSIPADLPSDPPSVCPRCGAGHDGGRFCDRCGRTVNPVARDGADASEPPMVTCLECGVPNAQDRSLCMSCGNPL